MERPVKIAQLDEQQLAQAGLDAALLPENAPFAYQWAVVFPDDEGCEIYSFGTLIGTPGRAGAPSVLSAAVPTGTEIVSFDTQRGFPWASVTKLAGALSTWVAIEQGVLDLDDTPADYGITALDFAGPGTGRERGPGQGLVDFTRITVADLLGHASGMAFDAPLRLAAPRNKRIYSNCGFDVLGAMLGAASGVSPAQWLDRTVFGPLGMNSATLTGPDHSLAYSGHSNLVDLGRLAAEFLAPTLLNEQALEFFTSPYLAGLPGILPGYGRQKDNRWALGAELRADKSPHWLGLDFPPSTFGHFGQSGSFLWVDRTAGRAGIFLGEEPFGAWHKTNWPALTSFQLQLKV